jgi:hypothetical protein
MGSSKEHQLVGNLHELAIKKVKRIMHATRNGYLYRSTDGINWNLEDDPNIAPVPEGITRVTELNKIKFNKNK